MARQSILVIIKRGRIIAVYMSESSTPLSISPTLITQALQFQTLIHQHGQVELQNWAEAGHKSMGHLVASPWGTGGVWKAKLSCAKLNMRNQD